MSKYIIIFFITIFVFSGLKVLAEENRPHSYLSRSDANELKEKLFNDHRSDILYSREKEMDELLIKIECRNLDGERCPENDIDIEIFNSGDQLNLILSWSGLLGIARTLGRD